SVLNKIALSLLKKDKSKKAGVKSKRKGAAWDEDYLLTILGF
ncbi:MAG TPA: ISAs1 family transposase, partial [Sphingobacterium sp.]|nr:ISAs1 family transposase [Sphingobacterium sp.]